MEEKNKNIKGLAFEEALAELEKIVAQLESGEASLENAINIYERGAQLKQHCEKKLNEARMKIDKISFLPEGEAEITELEEDTSTATQ